MKRQSLISILLIVLTVMIIFSVDSTQATSWVELDAGEVIEDAEVIVIGKYEPFKLEKTDDTLLTEQRFNVKGVYKGIATKTIPVGIDEMDFEWVNDFQDEDGEFLLFLEQDSVNEEFLTPVGGINGMVKVKNGEVIDQSNKNKKAFEEVLKEQSSAPLDDAKSNEPISFIYPVLLILAIVLVPLLVFGLSYFSQKNKTQRK